MSTFAERLKFAIERAEVSQSDLARACGVRPASVSDWLSGKSKSMRAPVAQKAAEFLNVSLIWLSTGEGTPESGSNVSPARLKLKKIPLITFAQAGLLTDNGQIRDPNVCIDHGELGPLDIQVIRGEDNPSRNSGLDFNSALNVAQNHVQQAYLDVLYMMINNGASNNLATKVASQIAASIAPPLYSQIDPIRIAHMRRLITVALEYGGRLAEKSNSITIQQLTNLITDYPSHGFVIDREEAKKLFNKVHNLDDCHEELKFYRGYRDKILTPKKEKDAIVDVFAPEKEKANESNESPKPNQQESKVARGKKSNERTTPSDRGSVEEV